MTFRRYPLRLSLRGGFFHSWPLPPLRRIRRPQATTKVVHCHWISSVHSLHQQQLIPRSHALLASPGALSASPLFLAVCAIRPSASACPTDLHNPVTHVGGSFHSFLFSPFLLRLSASASPPPLLPYARRLSRYPTKRNMRRGRRRAETNARDFRDVAREAPGGCERKPPDIPTSSSSPPAVCLTTNNGFDHPRKETQG